MILISLPPVAGEAGWVVMCHETGVLVLVSQSGSASFNRSAVAGIDYHGRFGISELSTKSAALVVPLEDACLGLIYSHFGYRDLARHSAGLACGLKLSETISARVQADFFAEKTAGITGKKGRCRSKPDYILSYQSRRAWDTCF